MDQADREQLVSAAFVSLADTLVDDYDVVGLLEQLVAHCVALLTAPAAGLLMGDPHGEPHPGPASDGDARTMELLQVQAGEGPCVDAWRTGRQVRVPDLAAAAHRWPVFVPAAARAGRFASVHSIPLRLRGDAIGALNLFHDAPGALPERDLTLAQSLADVATIGILQQRAIERGEAVSEQLQTALDSRVVIEQAKGVVSQRLGVGMGEAFELLRGYARRTHRSIAELARHVVEGDLEPALLSAPAPARSRSGSS